MSVQARPRHRAHSNANGSKMAIRCPIKGRSVTSLAEGCRKEKRAWLLVQQLLQGDGLFSRMKGDGGVAIVKTGAAAGDLLQDRVAFDDVQSKAFAGGENAQHDIVGMNDGPQRQHFVIGRANEMSGLGRELTQFFKLSHRLLQRNATSAVKVA